MFFRELMLKLLILRFSSIGDIVLTSPVLRCAHLQLGAEVHFLTKKAYAGILEANPHVSKVHVFDKEPDAALLSELRTERFDLVVDLHHNLRSLRIKWALGRPSKSFNKLNWEKWLLVRLKIDRMPDAHIVDRYLATLADLGVRYDGQGLDYFIPEGTAVDPVWLPRTPFVAFAIGATHATKRLPNNKIAEICDQLTAPVVLLGGKSEETDAEEILTKCSRGDLTNLCGKLSLHQSALVLKAAQKVIAHDTGLMHIAAALRKPMVSVWGSTVPKFGMWPLYPTGHDLNSSVEVAGLNCRPCSKIGHARCPKGHFKCMMDVDAHRVAGLASP
jgi:ADP-heptose:LPS heptosyltransferase